jgi:hypothetical protein
MDILAEAEDLIMDWIMLLPIEDQQLIHNGSDVIECINEEAEEEIKDQLWYSIKNSLSYRAILNRLTLHLNSVVETQSEEEDEDEDKENEDK